jgi:hypothetical protein
MQVLDDVGINKQLQGLSRHDARFGDDVKRHKPAQAPAEYALVASASPRRAYSCALQCLERLE